MKRTLLLVGLLLALVILIASKGRLVATAEPDAAAASGFDTGRAVARLQRVLGDERPHPVDSDANDAVRERLLAELRAIGLSPTVTDDLACEQMGESRTVACARVRNVLATIGPREGRHVLVVSHYDSTPVGPGAGDAGIGIASMLEIAALLRDRPLRRPVTFLFNEGEETGLVGARAFLDFNPLAAQVDSLVNLEARGVTGPAIMFETSRPNGRAIAHYARSGARPSANSLTTDFYKLMPNTTDVAVFEERGWTILNLAIIGNETRYHSAGDTVAALDPRSVADMGGQALAAVADMAATPAPDAGGEHIYADLFGTFLVVLPAWLGLAILGALLVVFVALAWRRRRGVGRAAAAFAAALAGSGALTALAAMAVGLVKPGEFWRAHPEAISFAVAASALLGTAAAIAWVGRPAGRDRLRIGFWLLFLVLGALICLVAPGAAIFFLLPPLLIAAGMLAERRVRRAAQLAALLAWAALFLTWAPLLHLTEILLNFHAAWIFALVAALMLFPLLAELKPVLVGRLPLAALAMLALAAWTIVALLPAYSLDRKQAFGIEYVLDEKGARWMVVNDGAPLPDRFEGFDSDVEVPWSGLRRWAAAAPGFDGAAARPAARLGEGPAEAGRLVSLRLPGGGVDSIMLRAEPEADLRAVRAGGRTHTFGKGRGPKEDFFFRCHGRACNDAVIELVVGGKAPAEATLISTRPGLPNAAQWLVSARPATAAPQYRPDATITVQKIVL